MERPSAQPSLVPVLLENCEPPDIRVDTISLAQLQWYRLYEVGIQRLIDYLARLTSPQAKAERRDAGEQAAEFRNAIELLRGLIAARDQDAKEMRAEIEKLRKQRTEPLDRIRAEFQQMWSEIVANLKTVDGTRRELRTALKNDNAHLQALNAKVTQLATNSEEVLQRAGSIDELEARVASIEDAVEPQDHLSHEWRDVNSNDFGRPGD